MNVVISLCHYTDVNKRSCGTPLVAVCYVYEHLFFIFYLFRKSLQAPGGAWGKGGYMNVEELASKVYHLILAAFLAFLFCSCILLAEIITMEVKRTTDYA